MSEIPEQRKGPHTLAWIFLGTAAFWSIVLACIIAGKVF